MKITLIQFKSKLGEVEKNFETAERLIDCAKNSDVAVLPELWTTGYFPTPLEKFADKNAESAVDFISTLSKKNNLNIIAGSVIAEVDGKFYNRSLISNRAGEIVATYDKAHLFTFAGEEKIFSAGNKIVKFEIDDVKCGIAICYDLRFPEFIRKIALQGAEVLFVPAAWSLKRLVPRQILTKARAIENQMFIVFVNSAGISEIINPLGETVLESKTDEQVLTVEIDITSRRKIIENMNLLADRNLNVDN